MSNLIDKLEYFINVVENTTEEKSELDEFYRLDTIGLVCQLKELWKNTPEESFEKILKHYYDNGYLFY